MDTSNRGVNYAVVNELRQCQTGYKKGVHGMAIPSAYPIKQKAKQLEIEAAKFLKPLPDLGGDIWVCEPKRARILYPRFLLRPRARRRNFAFRAFLRMHVSQSPAGASQGTSAGSPVGSWAGASFTVWRPAAAGP